jgi:hypothetical protein
VNDGCQPRVAVLSTTPLLTNSAYETFCVSRDEADGIVSLYSMYEFTDKLIVCSFDVPHGRKLRNLLDSGVATMDTLIDSVILWK